MSPNVCVCEQGPSFYYGTNCSICQPNYMNDITGPPCSLNGCFPHTCAGHGVCNPIDITCQCFGNFAPPFCDSCLPNFYGELCESNCEASGTCNGHGTCSNTGECQCFSDEEKGFFDGASCNTCQSGIFGPSCKCNSSSTCNNHGICNSQGTCDCIQGYSGQNCLQCKDNFYGESCKFCHPRLNCTNHGTCNSNGLCDCFSNNTFGFFAGESCNECQASVVGNSCNIKFNETYILGSNLRQIRGTLSFPELFSSIDCSLLFHSDDNPKTGNISFARCFWPNRANDPLDDTFVVDFSGDSNLRDNDTLLLNIGALDNPPSLNYRRIRISFNGSFPEPTSRIDSKTRFEFCENAIFDGSNSTSPDGRPLTYRWVFISGRGIRNLNQFLGSQKNSRIEIPNNLLFPNSTYILQLDVTNSFGIKQSSRKEFRKLALPIPKLDLFGRHQKTCSIDSECVLFATPSFPSTCYLNRFGDKGKPVFGWKQVSGNRQFRLNLTQSDNRYLIFPPFSFPAQASSYQFEFSFSILNSVKKELFTINTIVPPIRVSIKGGNDRTVSFNDSLVLEALIEDDAKQNQLEVCRWSCKSPSNKILLNINSLERVITFSARSLNPGTYHFSVNCFKGIRVGRSDVSIVRVKQFINQSIIPLTIESLPSSPIIRENQRLVLEGITNTNLNNSIEFRWSYNGFKNLSEIIETPLDRPKLVISPNTLLPGQTFKFTLSIYVNGNLSNTATIEKKINVPPSPGSCSATFPGRQGNSIPVANNHELNVICENWKDESSTSNLKYSFALISNGVRTQLSVRPTFDNFISLIPMVGGSPPHYNISIEVSVFDSLLDKTKFYIQSNLRPPEGDTLSVISQTRSILSISNRTSTNLYPASNLQLLIRTSKLLCSTENLEVFKVIKAEFLFLLKRYMNTDLEETTTETLSQFFEMVQCLSNNTATMNEDLNREILSVIQIKSKNFNGPLLENKETATQTLKGISTVTRSVVQNETDFGFNFGISKKRDLLSKQVNMTEQTTALYQKFLNALSENQVEGQFPTIISNDIIEVGVFSDFSNFFSSKNVTLDEIFITIPSLTSDRGNNTIRTNFKAFKINPYIESEASVRSNILDIEFTDDSSKISTLSEPLIFTLKGNFVPRTTDQLQNCTDDNNCEEQQVSQCMYWIQSDSSNRIPENSVSGWSSSGCSVLSINTSHITCSCEHTTSFSAIVDYVTPTLNLPNFSAIVTLNTDNITALIVMSSLLLAYITLLIFFKLFEATSTSYDTVLPDTKSTKGYVRPTWEKFKQSNLYLSNIVLPQKNAHFGHSQRLTVVYIGILGMFLSGALVYGQKQENQVQVLAAMIISDLVSWPFVFFFSFLFIFIAPGKSPKNPADEFDPSQVNPWSKLRGSEVQIDRVLRKSNENEDVVDELWKSIPEDQIDPINLSFVKQDHAKEDIQEDLMDQKKILKESFSDIFQRRIDVVIKNVDQLCDVIFKRLLSLLMYSRLFGIAVVIIMTLAVSSGVTFVVILLKNQVQWLPDFVVALIAVALFLLFFGVLEFLYMTTKNKMYQNNNQMKWRTTKSTVIVVLASMFLITLCIIIMVTFPIVQFIAFKYTQDWGISVVVNFTMAIFIVCIICFLIHHFRIPRRLSEKEKIEKKERKSKKFMCFLPHFFIVPAYLLAWGWILAASFIAVVYGIQFDNIKPGYATDWLLSSFLAVGQNCFLTRPFSFVVKLIAVQTLSQLFEGLFTNANFEDVININIDN